MGGLQSRNVEYAFKVNLVAAVKVHAADEAAARKVVPDVLGAPGTTEVALINENNAAVGHDAKIAEVEFNIRSITLMDVAPTMAAAADQPRRAAELANIATTITPTPASSAKPGATWSPQRPGCSQSRVATE
jgi:hypothetical protein